MPEFILAAVAWPYGNSRIHAGNLAGSYLPADIFSRYHRLKGNQVLMVSGTSGSRKFITNRRIPAIPCWIPGFIPENGIDVRPIYIHAYRKPF